MQRWAGLRVLARAVPGRSWPRAGEHEQVRTRWRPSEMDEVNERRVLISTPKLAAYCATGLKPMSLPLLSNT